MRIEKYTVNPFSENTYILLKEHKAIIVDPGFLYASEMDSFLDLLEEENAELEAILLTHAHIDHIIGIKKVRGRFEVPVYLHTDDHYFWENYMTQAAMFGFEEQPFDFEPKAIQPRQHWDVGSFSFDVRFTPGHAPGHVVFYIPEEDTVIAGDTLFRESIGRTDLYKGDFSLLSKSIKEQLYTLPGDTKVFPGHGPATSIAYEMENNPYVRI